MNMTDEATMRHGRSSSTAMAVTAAGALASVLTAACAGSGSEGEADGTSYAAETIATSASTMVATSSGLCVDVPGDSSATKLALQQYACDGSDAQSFSFAATSAGTYVIETANGLCLQTSGRSTVVQATCSNSTSQTWTVTAGAGGAFTLESASTNRCLTIAGDSLDSGAALVTSKCAGASDQLFTLADFTASAGTLAFGQPCAASTCTYVGATENVTATMSCSTGALSITSATYGQTGHTESCSSYVQAQCSGEASCSIDLDNTSCGGDPDYGVVKTGSVTVACSGTVATSDAGPPATTPDAGSGSATTAPAQAVAAGLTTLTFDDEFTIASIGTGSSPATYNWYATIPTSDYSVSGGVLTIKTDLSGYGDDITSANLSDQGHIFQYAYFEASMAFDPDGYTGAGAWPAFWSWAVEGDTVPANTPFTELDFMEAYPANPGTPGGGIAYITTIHQHTNTSTGALTDVANPNNYPGLPASTDYTQFHRYGCLWEPGKVTWYFDDQPGETVATGAGTSFTSIDSDHLFLTLGTGTNWPTKFDYVRVWQQ